MMIEAYILDFLEEHNYIREEEAINSDMVGLRIFDRPLIGYSRVDDPIYDTYVSDKNILSGAFLPPREWLVNGQTVVSVFFPYTDRIKRANTLDPKLPATEWLHGRYEGQQIISNTGRYVVEKIKAAGISIVCPSMDDRFKANLANTRETHERFTNDAFYCNWSERHVAYACGLGTFGLSKGIITEKGMAGRFISFIIDYPYEVKPRPYTETYEYCNGCGDCIKSCPVKAISFENGKQHYPCSKFLDYIYAIHTPRYACGKCQVGVACMSGIPSAH